MRLKLASSCRRSSFFVINLLILHLFTCKLARADTAAFDLIGPKVDVRVQRAGETLPISEVPNLEAGDRLWIHPDLPDSQSVHYLLIVAFLRGATNPPPESWFTQAQTWNKAVHEEGIYVKVPAEAEQALVFLAPDTGGAFSTLRGTVRARPGAFVRAAQDLEQAGLDRARLEAYLNAVRETSAADPEKLKARAPLLARSLNVRYDQECFDKPTAQQVPCLTQHTDELVLDDQHTQSMVATLTSGAPTDLIAQISSTPTARSGYYSPYIGAVVDMARILGSAHTARFQYIPALALPKDDELKLRLNNPPSFRNPKSVIVIALPPVRAAIVPPLRGLDSDKAFCVNHPDLVLPADGAPLVFATGLAHNFALHVETKSGTSIDLPVEPSASDGGFVVTTGKVKFAAWEGEATGTIRGFWGFRTFDGPRYKLRASRPAQWVVASKDASALIVGRADALHLQSAAACCVSQVFIKDETGRRIALSWTASKENELEVKVPLQNANAGPLKMLVMQYGQKEADEVSLHTFAEAGRLDSLTIRAGDSDGVLKGTRLDQVARVDVNGILFRPAGLDRADQHDELRIATQDPSVTKTLVAGAEAHARVTLNDGRGLTLDLNVGQPRPKLTLLSKSVRTAQDDSAPMIHLANANELPQDGKLTFFLKTQTPENFPPSEKIEVATSTEAFHVFLTVKDGNLTMQDSQTIFAVLDPMKLLGPSAFGPLKFRPVSTDGAEGDWQPLANLVRLPELKSLRCPAGPPQVASKSDDAGKPAAVDPQCQLNGDKLFLIDAVSADPDFSNPASVPDGFIDAALSVPAPKSKELYLKLRDDPSAIDMVEVPLNPATP